VGIPTTADVVVIGGGPAGSLASTVLAHKGHGVVLLERGSHPRPQVGESLIPDFWKYADLMKVTEKLEKEGFVSKSGAVVSWGGQVRAHSFGDFGYIARNQGCGTRRGKCPASLEFLVGAHGEETRKVLAGTSAQSRRPQQHGTNHQPAPGRRPQADVPQDRL